MRRLPPLGPIQAFVHVARLGSMKAAADTLALSSPALTRRIQALERFVGTALFERQHNALQLTSDGDVFLAAISPHLDALALAVDRVSKPTRGMRLRIAVPSLFASQRLMPALPSLQREYPDLALDLDTGANRLSRLNDGLDAAIVIAGRIDSKLYARVLERGRVVALGSKDIRDGPQSIRSPSDLTQHSVLLHRDMPEAFSEWRKMAGLPNLEPRAINYYDAGQLILDAAAESMGVAFMLESHLSYSADSRLVKIFEKSIESPYAYWFACYPSALERPSVRYFHDWLFNQFAPT
jgi:LysR family glycine cleavage system transcriptional activator